MGWKRRPGEGRSRKLERFKDQLAWKDEISSALADIHKEQCRAAPAASTHLQLHRRPLQLLPRSTPSEAVTAKHSGSVCLSNEEIRHIFAAEHRNVLMFKPSTLVDRCLHVIAKYFDRYPADDDYVVEAMHHGMSPDLHHRLSILSTWYETMTADNAAFVCIPTTQSLCLGQLNVDAFVLPLITPQVSTARADSVSSDAESWEDLPDILMTWTGCPHLEELELVACYEISIACLEECTNLTKLSLVDCSAFNAVDTDLLMHLPRRLQSLSLVGCTWLSNKMLMALLRVASATMLSLRYVRVWGCCRVSLVVEQAWAADLPQVHLDVKQPPHT
ncbi:hypothetical protein H310_02453 [Aphanomyces invadans]|uniref:Uncharacterized protein n=1 Tax=Aphanomyces invadans TaxID=157072 RepID=A0A024UNR1_9STRA|nr:hypothetical protein H310_02453 [Aphanomyces invadans]ETW08091.1 hypothetical protein H310_02453 [Aphanomyces invadans]|eukprot:XP_008864184.1 hypothetical protein H310_02453 [Aphanomyces invadans]